MNNLRNTVYDYYLSHIHELTPENQFHFASRLYLWNQDPNGKDIVDRLRPWFTANDQPEMAVRALAAEAIQEGKFESKNATELRQPYFKRYPLLKTYLRVLFRITFLYTIYGMDVRDTFLQLFHESGIEALSQALLNDPTATSILSTHAINLLYLYYGTVKNDTSALDPNTFLRIGHTQYDRSNNVHLQLLNYLYTHCIIGDSIFYARKIPASRVSVYTQMLRELEALVDDRFVDINLDNKFEFLACCRIVGYESTLVKRIEDEAERSQADDGAFLIDRHNNNSQTTHATLDRSEHRNVLFLLSGREFKPSTNLGS